MTQFIIISSFIKMNKIQELFPSSVKVQDILHDSKKKKSCTHKTGLFSKLLLLLWQ